MRWFGTSRFHQGLTCTFAPIHFKQFKIDLWWLWCDCVAIDLTTFTKILTWQSIGHMQSFRTFAIRYKKSQKLQDTHLVSILKVIRKKLQWMVNYFIKVNRVTMMDQAIRQQKRIYASLLSQTDWTKRTVVQKSHEKNWINFQNWIWRRNGSASFNLVFWILVVEILILVNNKILLL